MALMILGDFVFELKSLPYQQLQRSTAQRWAKNNRVQQRPAFQYVGPGDDTLTLTGDLYPEITGNGQHIDQLRQMAAAGEPYLLVDEAGYLHGWWVIESVDEGQENFFGDGTPRKLNFTVKLSQADKPGAG